MDIYRQQALEKVQYWFSKASNWQKDLFCTIWEGASNNEQIIDRTIKLVGQEYLSVNCRFAPKTIFPVELSFSDGNKPPVMLNTISNIRGVGALAPNAALQFKNGLNIVYGENGCGKSSYVRILKALENYANADNVLGNVFDEKPASAQADVVFSTDGKDHSITWNKTCKKRYPIQIYDTAAAKQFVDKENEVVYEPKVLSIITHMANVYEQVSSYYKNEAQKAQQLFSPLQQDISGHPIVKEFEKLDTLHNAEKFGKKYLWAENDKVELESIIESLKERNPLTASESLEAKKKIVRKHGLNILECLKYVNDTACEDYLRKRRQQIETKHIQDVLITANRKKSLLEHFASNTWRSMWQQARMYINEIESSEPEIPITKSGLCALCQQKLDDSAKDRMQSFNDFLKSTAITEAQKAYDVFKSTVTSLQREVENKIDLDRISDELEASAISPDIHEAILIFYRGILERCEWLLTYDDQTSTECPEMQTQQEITDVFKKIIMKMDTQIKAFKDANANQEKQKVRKNELVAINWTASNLPAKMQLLRIQGILKDCKTNTLTTLKKELSRLLITNEYISRFQTEMDILDEKRQIKVELVEAAPKRGKSYHQISLKGAKSAGTHKNGEVLSEGEFRIVSLAAFLADLSAWGRVMPFVFDDPITSLDQRYEARVAARLVQLSMERQVIVFTHRLAFAQLLNSEAVNYNIAADKRDSPERVAVFNSQLRRSPLGYPESPAFLKDVSIAKAISYMRGNDIPAIKRKQKDGDFAMADYMIKSLCSDFRKVVEQGIAQDLLSGIVTRYGRNVSTLKLPRLYAMTQDDISLFDRMMSKYSCYEHSQSVEISISLPDVSDIEADMDVLETWAKDYEKRCQAEAKKSRGSV